MGATPNNVEFYDGIAKAQPYIIYGPNGQPISSSNPLPASTNTTGTPTEAAVSVGVTSTPVLGANPNRKFLLLINDSPNTIYLSIGGNTAVLNTGQRLNLNGGSLLLDRYIPTSAIKAIASVAASNLLVTEG
jgi:hypothetical protein